VQSFLFYRRKAAVIERIILQQKWQAPQFHDHYHLVIDALVPMRTLIERTERGETTLSEFFVEQLTCIAAGKRKRGAGNAIASQLLRFATTGDSLLHELAYVFTPDGHARFQMMKRQCVPPVVERAVSDEGVDVFCERLAKLVGKLIEMMNYMLPKDASDEAMGHVFDNYLACDQFWGPGENFRTGWLNKRNKILWSGKLHCDVNLWSDFREIAMIITQMPASEAAAERLFSILQCAFNKDRVSALLDILDATLAIRMWQVHHAPEEVGPNAPSVLRARPDL
jgi:hypothetical protein